MKYRLLDHIVCDICKGYFRVEVKEAVEVDYARIPEFATCANCSFGDTFNCTDCIRYEIKSGRLLCSCGRAYPIVDFTPVLLNSNTVSDTQTHFDAQWRFWGGDAKIYGKTKDEMLNWCFSHLIPSHVSRDYFKERLILDAGCGHGKFSVAFAELDNEVIGMDITSHVRKVYVDHVGIFPLLHFIQADVLHPPLKQERFDYVFSEGVIHHTGDTRRAFKELLSLVKPRGMFGIWVYPHRSRLFEIYARAIRTITSRLPKNFLYVLSYIPVPLLSVIKAYSRTSLKNASWRQCAQVVFDFFGPQFQSHHTEAEIKKWFFEEGIERVEFAKVDPVSVSAVK
ncbi:MAG: methyltransferase domain-containing protein [Candidatus Omnitrophota bacterium]